MNNEFLKQLYWGKVIPWEIQQNTAALTRQEMPNPSEFLSEKQRDGSTLCTAEIYENV